MLLYKPKFWDYKKSNFLSSLLLPFSAIISISNWINFLYYKKKFKIKTICVGNIYVGGTGKTPISIEIFNILKKFKVKSVFVKKNYFKHKDEIRLLSKIGPIINLSSRIKSIAYAEKKKFESAIIDDGLQDKSLKYDLKIVCFNKKNFIGNGRVIPAGPLRESLNKIERYKNIFFSGNDENDENLKEILSKNCSNLNFFDSKYKLLNLDKFDLSKKYVVFSGIGNHETFIDMLKKNNFQIIKDFEFSDHYNYVQKDITRITKFALENNAEILTTEKDYLRLSEKLQSGINFTKINLEISQIEKLKKKIIELV